MRSISSVTFERSHSTTIKKADSGVRSHNRNGLSPLEQIGERGMPFLSPVSLSHVVPVTIAEIANY